MPWKCWRGAGRGGEGRGGEEERTPRPSFGGGGFFSEPLKKYAVNSTENMFHK
jgi:hypothetical protein